MKMLLSLLAIFLLLYAGVCMLLYFFQEKFIFFPQKLSPAFKFSFPQKFEEIAIKTKDNISLNAILFKANSSKGVVFYLHGNAGSLSSWGEVAEVYTSLNYDVFMPDYRGYGKSEGTISSEKQLHNDVQAAYDKVKSMYDENSVIVLGYSIGTGPAAKVASVNRPKLLILQAPFYSMTDVMKKHYPIIPTFVLKYKFETGKFIKNCAVPIVIFHGDADEITPYSSSIKLKEAMKKSDIFITLKGEGHNGMSSNPDYLSQLQKILMK